jgi:hypothetical protein
MKLFERRSPGLEMVEIAILIAIVVALGLIFKAQLTAFINKVFGDLMNADFYKQQGKRIRRGIPYIPRSDRGYRISPSHRHKDDGKSTGICGSKRGISP